MVSRPKANYTSRATRGDNTLCRQATPSTLRPIRSGGFVTPGVPRDKRIDFNQNKGRDSRVHSADRAGGVESHNREYMKDNIDVPFGSFLLSGDQAPL